MDLKEYWNFDLVSFIAGEVFSSITLIFAMIRNLPEGSRFVASMTVDNLDKNGEAQRLTDPRTEAVMDHRVWTIDRRLQAMAVNAIYTNTAVSGQWKDKLPEFPIIGPADWQGPPAEPRTEPVYTDNFDLFRKMGWPVG